MLSLEYKNLYEYDNNVWQIFVPSLFDADEIFLERQYNDFLNAQKNIFQQSQVLFHATFVSCGPKNFEKGVKILNFKKQSEIYKNYCANLTIFQIFWSQLVQFSRILFPFLTSTKKGLNNSYNYNSTKHLLSMHNFV
eukprot:TRINITY_DN4516_c1_g1_i1.p2 TRINITY_DN4516_c1_g1~~TRINITY_DN4516_c1_g1_i1.p2  ORF type:complete len:137 (-),score=9.30 TRINITY_DN4516_c1_g1_i1:18-428(-)